MVAKAPKHRKRQQLRKRLKTYTSVSVTTDQNGTKGRGVTRNILSGKVETRESASLPGVTNETKTTSREFERIADAGTQAVTVTIRGCRDSRRKLRHYQRSRNYRLLNDCDPVQVTGELESYGIGLRGFKSGTVLEDAAIDWLKQQLWVKSVQVTCQSLPGNGMEYRKTQDQRKHDKQTKTHDPLRRRSGTWGT